MRRKDTTKIRLQSEEWFEKNCHKDYDDDWWESKEACKKFDSTRHLGGNPDLETYLYTNEDCQTSNGRDFSFDEIIDAENDESKHWEWAVKEYITREKCPEEYL